MTFYSSFFPSETAAGLKGSAAFLGAQNTALVYLYRRSTTTLTNLDRPNGNVIYTFTTGNTNISSVSNGWSTTIPSGYSSLYVVTASAISTDPTYTILSASWSSPVVLAQNGNDGLNTATVFLFKRSNTNTIPAVPTQTSTYTFSTGTLIGASSTGNTTSPYLNGWTQSAPDSAGGKYLFVTTATASNTTTTDTILSSEWSTVQVMAQDGAQGYTAYLTNETTTLAADSSGTVTDYSTATGKFIIYLDGIGDISSNFTLSTLSNPTNIQIGYSGNTYTVTSGFNTVNTAAITIRATGIGIYTGIIIDKIFSISKSKAGNDGAPAKSISVTVNRQLIAYNSDGTLQVTSPAQNITATATKQNTSATVSWTIVDALGYSITPVASYLSPTSGTGDSTTLTGAKFSSAISVNGAQGLTLTATIVDNGITYKDSVTIMKVQAGAKGVDGVVIDLSLDAVTVPSNSDGSNPILTSAITTLRVYEGAAEATSNWSLTATPSSGLTGNFTANVYTVTGLTTDAGYVDFSATKAGYSTQNIRFNIAKAKAGSDSIIYTIEPSAQVVRRSNTGIFQPSSIVFSSYKISGTVPKTTYSGRFIVYTSSDGITYSSPVYTSSINESSISYTIPTNISYIKVELYLSGGISTLLNTQQIPIVVDGAAGVDGTSAIAGYLTSEASSIVSYADGSLAPSALGTANGYLKVYQGANEVTSSAIINSTVTISGCTARINTADNTPVSGKLKGYFEITGLTSDTGTATFSATYSGTTITKTYSISKAKGGYEIVSILPTTNLFTGRIVYLTSDSKLYRYIGSQWTSTVASADISGTLTSAQITSLDATKLTGTLSADLIAANTIVASKLALFDPSNIITDSTFIDTGYDSTNNYWDLGTSATDTVTTWSVVDTTSDTTSLGVKRGVKSPLGNNNTSQALSSALVDKSNISIEPLKSYRIYAVARVSISFTGLARVLIRWYKADGTAASTASVYITATSSDFRTTAAAAATNFIYEGIVQAPSDAQYAQYELRVDWSTTRANAGYVVMASPRLMRALTSELVVDGSIKANSLDVNSVTANAISAGAVVAGKIGADAVTATNINVTNLSSVSATIGTLQTATSGARTVVQDNLITIYDANNVVRVKMGIW